MPNAQPMSPNGAVAEVVRLWTAGASPDALLARLRELANDTAGQLGPMHVYQITTGYRDGYEIGRAVRMSGVAIDGEPLYRVAFDQGHWAGTKRKLLVVGGPVLLAAAAAVALSRG